MHRECVRFDIKMRRVHCICNMSFSIDRHLFDRLNLHKIADLIYCIHEEFISKKEEKNNNNNINCIDKIAQGPIELSKI